MSVKTDIMAALSREWKTARRVHEQINCWAPVTIRHQLRKLEESGEIEGMYRPHPNGEVTVYRLTG